MASSCIPTGLRLDLEMVKAAAASAPPPGAHSSPLRPALSEASNSSTSSSLSLKRARTPRKRPNQTYNEAAALLASMYPSVFPVRKSPETAPPRLLGIASALADDPACSDLLPPFPVLGNAAFLLRDMPQPPTPRSPVSVKSCPSPAAVSSVFREFRDPAPSPGTPEAAAAAELGELDFDDNDGFVANSFLGVEEGAAEGIDDIMGKLSMESNATTASGVNPVLSSSGIHPYLRSLMVLGLGFRQGRHNINQALKRHDDDNEWWMCPAMPVNDITPAPSPLVALPAASEKKKKSKNKVEKVLGREKDVAVGQCKRDEKEIPYSANGDAGISALKALKTGLGLNLNMEEVLKAWCNRGSVFGDSNAPDSPRSSTDVLAKPADIDLFLENGAGGFFREGSMLKMQHKQKQCTPLLSNKTRYQARKVNTDCRPRVKGRFVSKAAASASLRERELGEDRLARMDIFGVSLSFSKRSK